MQIANLHQLGSGRDGETGSDGRSNGFAICISWNNLKIG